MPHGAMLLGAVSPSNYTTGILTYRLGIVNSSEPFDETVQPWALLSGVSREEHLFGN
jgi:hypothetical protein